MKALAVWGLLFLPIIGFAQAKTPGPTLLSKNTKIIVHMADSDCESDRFKSRVSQELANRGLAPTDDLANFDYDLRVAFRVRNVEGDVQRVTLKQIYQEKNNAPENTVNATWASLSPEERVHAMTNAVLEEVANWKDRVRVVYIAESPADLRTEVTRRLEAAGYKLLSNPVGADLSIRLIPTVTSETRPQQRLDYIFQVTERRTKNVIFAKQGNKVDSGIYEEPLDLVAGAAIAVAKALPVKP
jgi:hypothetical protein